MKRTMKILTYQYLIPLVSLDTVTVLAAAEYKHSSNAKNDDVKVSADFGMHSYSRL